MVPETQELDLLENPTEEEIISLWRALQAGGLAEEEAWHAIMTGIALDLAFARSKSVAGLVH